MKPSRGVSNTQSAGLGVNTGLHTEISILKLSHCVFVERRL